MEWDGTARACSKMAQMLTSCGDRVCLVGPLKCGKTSLLFQLPLLNTSGLSPSAHLLRSIKFQYSSTLRELVSVFDTLHLAARDEVPTCIIVDNLCHYFAAQQQSRWQDLAADMAYTCAHIVDGVEFVTQQQSSPCSLIVSLGQPSSIRTELVKRWLPSIMEIAAAPGANNSDRENYSILHNKKTIATYAVEGSRLYFL
ncbi:hypothetical protein EMCRGX_G014648 [Ephydatia muelleri]